MHVHPRAYVCIINEKTKGKFRGEHHVVWIGKTKHTREKGVLAVFKSNKRTLFFLISERKHGIIFNYANHKYIACKALVYYPYLIQSWISSKLVDVSHCTSSIHFKYMHKNEPRVSPEVFRKKGLEWEIQRCIKTRQIIKSHPLVLNAGIEDKVKIFQGRRICRKHLTSLNFWCSFKAVFPRFFFCCHNWRQYKHFLEFLIFFL